MNSKLILGLIILVLGVIVGWYIIGAGKPFIPSVLRPGAQTTQISPSPTKMMDLSQIELNKQTDTTIGGTKGGSLERSVVTYTEKGFGPSQVTVKVGTIVTFVNESSKNMWVASDPHPTHVLLPGFDQLKNVGKSGTYEYTFTKIGTWKYHNHMSPSEGGTVVVTQ